MAAGQKLCFLSRGRGEDAVSRWDIVWQYISVPWQHCGVRAAPRSRFLANLVRVLSTAVERRGPPRSVAASVNGSRQPAPVQRKPKENRNVRVCIAA